MTGVIIGEVLSLNIDGILIEDQATKEKITAIPDGGDLFDFKVGDTGIFVGNIYNGTIRVKRYEIRKFLDPLYEEDLFDSAGKYTMIPPINNPFTKTFEDFMKLRAEQEERALQEALELEALNLDKLEDEE